MYTRVCIHMSIGHVQMPSYSRSHVYHMDVHLSLHVYPYIYPYLGVYQYFLSTTLLVADNSTTGAWHLDQLAIGEERAKEHKRQRECFLIIDDLIATFDLCAAGTLAFRVAC